jgi:hypothetical protein
MASYSQQEFWTEVRNFKHEVNWLRNIENFLSDLQRQLEKSKSDI